MDIEYKPICHVCKDRGYVNRLSGAIVFEDTCVSCDKKYQYRRKKYKKELMRVYRSM